MKMLKIIIMSCLFFNSAYTMNSDPSAEVIDVLDNPVNQESYLEQSIHQEELPDLELGVPASDRKKNLRYKWVTDCNSEECKYNRKLYKILRQQNSIYNLSDKNTRKNKRSKKELSKIMLRDRLVEAEQNNNIVEIVKATLEATVTGQQEQLEKLKGNSTCQSMVQLAAGAAAFAIVIGLQFGTQYIHNCQ